MSTLKTAFALGLFASTLTVSAFAANPKAEMKVAKRGTIIIELRPDLAPKTVEHFIKLVNEKFYDGILFHRFEEGFVVQGGDPSSKKIKTSDIADITREEVQRKYPTLGQGGSGKNVPLEAKGSHTKGTVGLARSGQPDSGDSQFFFNIADNSGKLDALGYCVFGKVVKGENVMNELRRGDKIESVRILKAKPEPKKRKK